MTVGGEEAKTGVPLPARECQSSKRKRSAGRKDQVGGAEEVEEKKEDLAKLELHDEYSAIERLERIAFMVKGRAWEQVWERHLLRVPTCAFTLTVPPVTNSIK